MARYRVLWQLDADAVVDTIEHEPGDPVDLICSRPEQLGLTPASRLRVQLYSVPAELVLVETVTTPEIERDGG